MSNSIAGIMSGGCYPVPTMRDRLIKMDTDGNGGISKEEMTQAFVAMGRDTSNVDKIFSLLDVNGDGEISQADKQAAWENWLSKIPSKSGSADALTSQEGGNSFQTVFMNILNAK